MGSNLIMGVCNTNNDIKEHPDAHKVFASY